MENHISELFFYIFIYYPNLIVLFLLATKQKWAWLLLFFVGIISPFLSSSWYINWFHICQIGFGAYGFYLWHWDNNEKLVAIEVSNTADDNILDTMYTVPDLKQHINDFNRPLQRKNLILFERLFFICTMVSLMQIKQLKLDFFSTNTFVIFLNMLSLSLLVQKTKSGFIFLIFSILISLINTYLNYYDFTTIKSLTLQIIGILFCFYGYKRWSE